MIEKYLVAVDLSSNPVLSPEMNAYIGEMSYDLIPQWLVMYKQDGKDWWLLQGLMTQASCRICMSAPNLFSSTSDDPLSEGRSLYPPFGPADVGDVVSENTHQGWALQGVFTKRDARYKDAKHSTVWVCFGKPKLVEKSLFKLKCSGPPDFKIKQE